MFFVQRADFRCGWFSKRNKGRVLSFFSPRKYSLMTQGSLRTLSSFLFRSEHGKRGRSPPKRRELGHFSPNPTPRVRTSVLQPVGPVRNCGTYFFLQQQFIKSACSCACRADPGAERSPRTHTRTGPRTCSWQFRSLIFRLGNPSRCSTKIF